MNCADCEEPITESERRNARTCATCKAHMHAECSMAGFDEEDLCEPCHTKSDIDFQLAAALKGCEA